MRITPPGSGTATGRRRRRGPGSSENLERLPRRPRNPSRAMFFHQNLTPLPIRFPHGRLGVRVKHDSRVDQHHREYGATLAVGGNPTLQTPVSPMAFSKRSRWLAPVQVVIGASIVTKSH